MTPARKRARGPLKGRTLVAIGLLTFVAVAVLVVWRRSLGAATENDMRKLRTERRGLESRRVTLRRNINEAQSRPRIEPLAERRLGLHRATESQTRELSLPDSTQ